ncbi:hypothetical protein [Roseiflexus sp.]|uniref:hypothetical protein n=1 Tax=Roseiflexus sp. TaxID=2562120 RepID=UPI00398B28CD
MNLWILTSQFPPSVVGGIARYVANAADMFARAGHRVTVVAADQEDSEEVLPSGARVLRFAPKGQKFERFVAMGQVGAGIILRLTLRMLCSAGRSPHCNAISPASNDYSGYRSRYAAHCAMHGIITGHETLASRA